MDKKVIISFSCVVVAIFIVYIVSISIAKHRDPAFLSEEEMREALDGQVYTNYEDGNPRRSLSFSGDRVIDRIIFTFVDGSDYSHDIVKWNPERGYIILDSSKQIHIKKDGSIKYDSRIYELGAPPAPTPENPTGNPFLDAPEVDYSSPGGGVVKVIFMSKKDAESAGEDVYTEFLNKRVERYASFYETVSISFEDGTGITYYGCIPFNNTYGEMGLRGLILEPYGFIIHEDDGSYSYREIKDEE